MTPLVKVALYARVSTLKGQDTGLQLEELRRVAEARGWVVVAEYVDEGVSGAKARRPALDALMASARAGEIDVVAVWRFDRFARSVRHLLTALDEFRTLGVDFLSVRENIETSTPMGRAMFTLCAVVSELEREILRERVQAGVDRARRQGRRLGRPQRKLDLRAAKLLLEEGHSVRQVADVLGLPRTTLRRHLSVAA